MEQAKSSKGEPGRFERTGPVGRIGRVVLGLLLAWYLTRFLGS